jgi:putative peptidoglycan lipid II flippase
VLSRNAAQKDTRELLQTIRRGICGALFIALPATAGMILIGRPLMRVIFERGEFTGSDTQQTAVILYFYAAGLCGYFCQQILTRVYYSLGQSKPPAMTAVLAVAVNVCLNLILIWPMGASGLALSTAFCSYLQVTILLVLLRRRLGGQILGGWGSSILKTAAGTAGLVLAGIVGLRLMKGRPDTALWDLIRIGILVCVCGGVYLLIAWLGRNEMLSLLTGKMASRRAQTPPGEGS